MNHRTIAMLSVFLTSCAAGPAEIPRGAAQSTTGSVAGTCVLLPNRNPKGGPGLECTLVSLQYLFDNYFAVKGWSIKGPCAKDVFTLTRNTPYPDEEDIDGFVQGMKLHRRDDPGFIYRTGNVVYCKASLTS